MSTNKILSPFQHGFRQKRSCESQLLTTLRDFSDSLNSSGQTDAILLDFSKAFDKVDHRLLLSKMNNLGICGPLLKWATSFLSNRLQHVVVDGCISGANKVLSGVPQGTDKCPTSGLLNPPAGWGALWVQREGRIRLL